MHCGHRHADAKQTRWSLFVSLIIHLVFTASLFAEAPAPGRLIEKVVCADDASQSYSLYLPSNYDPAKKWPVLFCFDPGARGSRAVECFRAGGEKFGYVLAGSNNSRNGPWLDIAKAIEAMQRDTFARWAIDRERVYAAGLSGGGRVATQLGLSGLARGVIACSGAFLPNRIPGKVSFLFFGTAGFDDFNYPELRNADEELDRIGAPHRIVTFAGGHEWPPVAIATEAVEWLEIQSMKAGLREPQPALIEASYQRRTTGLVALPIPDRWLETKSLAADFKGLAEISTLEKAAAELAGTRELRRWRKEERELDRRQNATLEQWMAGVSKSTVASWQKRTDAPEDSPERRLSRRVLQAAFGRHLETARALFDRKDYGKAAAFLEQAILIQPARTGVWFELSRARMLDGNKIGALAALKQLAASGYKDDARLLSEPAFAVLQKEAAFQELLQNIARNRAAVDAIAPRP